MAREDVVWRADTGQYHARASGLPLLMPPMLGAQAPAAAAPSTSREPCGCSSWGGSPELTNFLLLLIFLAIVAGVLKH